MLFDPRPKKLINEIFDREKEISTLRSSLDSPLILIYGLRRVGKTSLVLSTLNSLKADYLFLDARVFEQKEYISYKDFLSIVEKEVNEKINGFKGLENLLSKIRGVSIAGVSVSFSWGKTDKVEFVDILTKVDQWAKDNNRKVIIVIDEAQELLKLRGYNILPSIAYAYDHLDRLSFIITGSEVRAFSKFLKLDDINSPLYGRAHVKMQLGPFDRNASIEFLKKGFEEHKIAFEKGDKVYDEFGGNPGWLTLFGYLAIKEGFDTAMEEAGESARGLLKKEFMSFLNEGGRIGSRNRYIRVIKSCKEGCTWSDIKASLEALEGREINDKATFKLIKNLMEYSFLIKENGKYRLSDKLLGEALR